MADAPRPYLPAVYLLAIFLPLGIAPAEIALGAGLLIWAGTLVRRGWNRSPVDAPLLAFFLAGLASAAASADPAGSARAAISCWTLLTFFLAREAASDLRTVRRLLLVLSIAGTVAAAVGIVAGLLGGQGPVDGLLTWLGVPSPARFGGRVSGFFSHPMTFAGQQAMLLVVCATLAGGRLRSPSEDDAGEPAWRGGLRFVPVAVMALGLVLSAARAAFTAAALSLGAASLVVRGRRRPAVIGLVLLLVAASLGGSLLAHRLAATAGTTPGPGRSDLWFAALDMLRERPLLGVGPGRYRHEVGQRIDMSRQPPTHAHSTPLQVAAETGLVGLSALLWIGAAFFAALTPRYWRMRGRGDPRAALMLASLLAIATFAAIGLFEHDLGDGEVVMLAAFLAGLPFGRAFDRRRSS